MALSQEIFLSLSPALALALSLSLALVLSLALALSPALASLRCLVAVHRPGHSAPPTPMP